jgi:hypothetical protein
VRARSVPWAWTGLLVAIPVAGAVVLPLMWLTDQFRYGLDADMVHLWGTRSPLWFALAIPQAGLLATPFLILAYWLVRWRRLQRRWFVVIASAVPASLLLGLNLYYAIDEALRPTRGIMPFEANSFSYLPNYLGPASIAVALCLAALTYLAFAKPAKERT